MHKMMSVLVAGVLGLSAAVGFAADTKPVEAKPAAAVAATPAAAPVVVKKEAAKQAKTVAQKTEAKAANGQPEAAPAAVKVEKKDVKIAPKMDDAKPTAKP